MNAVADSGGDNLNTLNNLDNLDELTHDLRSRLTAAAGFARLLVDEVDTLSAENMHDFLGRLSANIDRASSLLDAWALSARRRADAASVITPSVPGRQPAGAPARDA